MELGKPPTRCGANDAKESFRISKANLLNGVSPRFCHKCRVIQDHYERAR